jgi:hypothetical protein
MVQSLSLCLRGCVVQIGRFKKFLEMVLQLSCLTLEVMLSGCDILLIGVASFLIVAVVARPRQLCSGGATSTPSCHPWRLSLRS